MEQDGHLKSLAERMREKAEQERIETEKVFTEQLRTLSASLTASSQNALRTMSDAMAGEITSAATKLNQHYRLLSAAFARKWIATAVLGLFLCLGILAGGWATARYWERNLQRYRDTLARLEKESQAQREEQRTMIEAVDMLNTTFATLMDETSGVAIIEKNGSRYVTAPKGSENGHIINGRPAIKLKEE